MPGAISRLESQMEQIRMDAIPAAAFPYLTSSPALLPTGRQEKRVRWGGHVLLYGVATALALATAGECHGITYWPSVLYGGVLWLWWAGIASAMWKLSQRAPIVTSFRRPVIAAHMGIGSVLAGVHLLALWSLGLFWPNYAHGAGGRFMWHYLMNINRFGIEILLYAFVFAMTGILQYQLRAQQEAIRALELERQLSAAHLQALQMQLEPHFLFNTLNAITTLVELERSKPAAEMLTHLNAILKSTLQRESPEKVTLAQELALVDSYLSIEQVRFADRLRLEITVDPSALDCLIPCFLLQPIVENSIRHCIAHCEDEGRIEASARREGGMLHLCVRDSGSNREAKGALQSSGGHGIGLRNTRARLAHFYPEGHAMTAQTLATGGFEVAITIPCERATA
ncbi:sensor histidine kinase [Silvibacterium sp.]|uniref:sensor histidine kinase n=1 Tax=Silvibacterium sp. TaxID=1964179 RepID=UPI0039E53176